MDKQTALHIARVALVMDKRRCLENWLICFSLRRTPASLEDMTFWAERIMEDNDAHAVLMNGL